MEISGMAQNERRHAIFVAHMYGIVLTASRARRWLEMLAASRQRIHAPADMLLQYINNMSLARAHPEIRLALSVGRDVAGGGDLQLSSSL